MADLLFGVADPHFIPYLTPWVRRTGLLIDGYHRAKTQYDQNNHQRHRAAYGETAALFETG